jgi:hypothetical protein
VIGNSINVDSAGRSEGETTHLAETQKALFSNLTQIENLQKAYMKVIEDSTLGSPVGGPELLLADDDLNGFLEDLSKELRSRTVRATGEMHRLPAECVKDTHATNELKNRIMQILLAQALESLFPTDTTANPIAWTAAAIGRGLSRVYAVTIEESAADQIECMLAAVRQHVVDPAFLALLGHVLKSIDFRNGAQSNPLTSVLAHIAFHNVDQVLHQANLLGRQGSFMHASCCRFYRDVVVVLDNDAQYDWLLSAVQKRLREALVEIKAEVDPEKTRLVDLARGEKLNFLDHEFRLIKDGEGTAHVRCKALMKAGAPKPEAQKANRSSWKLPLLRWSRLVRRPKPVASEKALPGSRLHWAGLEMHRPRWSWKWSLQVPRAAYVLAVGVMIGAGVLAASLALLRNSGPQLYPASGQVFCEGKPATGALVVFLPKDPTSPSTHVASARVGENGRYILGTHKAKDGALAGPYIVTIWTRQSLTTQVQAKYGKRETTPLTAIVEMGRTEVPAFHVRAESP